VEGERSKSKVEGRRSRWKVEVEGRRSSRRSRSKVEGRSQRWKVEGGRSKSKVAGQLVQRNVPRLRHDDAPPSLTSAMTSSAGRSVFTSGHVITQYSHVSRKIEPAAACFDLDIMSVDFDFDVRSLSAVYIR